MTNILQRCVSPAFEPTYLSPRIGHKRVFPLKWEWYVRFSSGRSPYFFSPDSVVLACPCTYHVTNRTFGFIWHCWVFLTGISTKPPGPEDQHFNGMLQPAAAKTPPGYSPTGIALFWWEATEDDKPMTRLALWFISTLWKDWTPLSPVQSTNIKLKSTSAAKRIKGYLEDTEAGILWTTWWWLTVRTLQLYCLFTDFDFLFMLICKYSFLQPHFLDTTVIALQKPLRCNHSTYTYMLYR